MEKAKFKIAPIGMRMVKTAIAVNICFIINLLTGNPGITSFSAVTAIICMQPYMENSGRAAADRIGGTLIGAFFGTIVLFIIQYSFFVNHDYIRYTFISLFVILVIYTTVLIGKPQTSFFASVVFLSITATYKADMTVLILIMDRIIETTIGIVVSLAVNAARIPRRKQKDILFVSALDDTILGKDGSLTAFNKFELNRMIGDGINFTIATERTPASLIEALKDVNINLPIITMNGAALYDINLRKYIRLNTMDEELTQKVVSILDDMNVGYFVNVIVQDVLLIYLNEITNIEMQDTYQRLRRSPYRNYIYSHVPKDQKATYIYMINKTKIINQVVDTLKQQEFFNELSLVTGVEKAYESCSHLKIYHKTANKKSMIEYLVKRRGLNSSITFGSVEGKYDVVVKGYNDNMVVKTIKNMYEPYFWRKRK